MSVGVDSKFMPATQQAEHAGAAENTQGGQQAVVAEALPKEGVPEQKSALEEAADGAEEAAMYTSEKKQNSKEVKDRTDSKTPAIMAADRAQRCMDMMYGQDFEKQNRPEMASIRQGLKKEGTLPDSFDDKPPGEQYFMLQNLMRSPNLSDRHKNILEGKTGKLLETHGHELDAMLDVAEAGDKIPEIADKAGSYQAVHLASQQSGGSLGATLGAVLKNFGEDDSKAAIGTYQKMLGQEMRREGRFPEEGEKLEKMMGQLRDVSLLDNLRQQTNTMVGSMTEQKIPCQLSSGELLPRLLDQTGGKAAGEGGVKQLLGDMTTDACKPLAAGALHDFYNQCPTKIWASDNLRADTLLTLRSLRNVEAG